MKSVLIVLGFAAVALAQQQQRQYNSNQYAQPTTTPVPILKQLNRHNDDGSYSYGYEAADGSFKIETKHQNGEVYGKYGYVDDTGKVREVEYGASKQRGFEPQGTDINVPPSTADDQNYAAIRPLGPGEEDDGQYREDPNIYWKDERYNKPAAAPVQKQAPRQQYYQPQQQVAPQYDEQEYEQPQQYQAAQHRFQYAQQREAQAPVAPRQQYYQPQAYQQPQQQRYQAPAPQPGYDINTGSYSVSYSG